MALATTKSRISFSNQFECLRNDVLKIWNEEAGAPTRPIPSNKELSPNLKAREISRYSVRVPLEVSKYHLAILGVNT